VIDALKYARVLYDFVRDSQQFFASHPDAQGALDRALGMKLDPATTVIANGKACTELLKRVALCDGTLEATLRALSASRGAGGAAGAAAAAAAAGAPVPEAVARRWTAELRDALEAARALVRKNVMPPRKADSWARKANWLAKATLHASETVKEAVAIDKRLCDAMQGLGVALQAQALDRGELLRDTLVAAEAESAAAMQQVVGEHADRVVGEVRAIVGVAHARTLDDVREYVGASEQAAGVRLASIEAKLDELARVRVADAGAGLAELIEELRRSARAAEAGGGA